MPDTTVSCSQPAYDSLESWTATTTFERCQCMSWQKAQRQNKMIICRHPESAGGRAKLIQSVATFCGERLSCVSHYHGNHYDALHALVQSTVS